MTNQGVIKAKTSKTMFIVIGVVIFLAILVAFIAEGISSALDDARQEQRQEQVDGGEWCRMIEPDDSVCDEDGWK